MPDRFTRALDAPRALIYFEDEDNLSPEAVEALYERTLSLAELYRTEEYSGNLYFEHPADLIKRDLSRPLTYPCNDEILAAAGPPALQGRYPVIKQLSSSSESNSNNNDTTAASRERKLRHKVKKALKNNDIRWDDMLDDIMAALKKLGVQTTSHFEYVTPRELQEEGITAVTARVLIKEFAPPEKKVPTRGPHDPEAESASNGSKTNENSDEPPQEEKSLWGRFIEWLRTEGPRLLALAVKTFEEFCAFLLNFNASWEDLHRDRFVKKCLSSGY